MKRIHSLAFALMLHVSAAESANAASRSQILWLREYPIEVYGREMTAHSNSVVKFDIDKYGGGYIEYLERSENDKSIQEERTYNLFKNHFRVNNKENLIEVINEINQNSNPKYVMDRLGAGRGCFVVELKSKYGNAFKIINRDFIIINNGAILSNFRCSVFYIKNEGDIKSCSTFTFWPFKSHLNMALSSGHETIPSVFVRKLFETYRHFEKLNINAVNVESSGSLLNQKSMPIPSPDECQLIELGRAREN